MIPEFNDHGYLPAGVHRARWQWSPPGSDGTELRRVQMESLGWLADLARRAGARRLIVNGSFVTDRPEPNHVDCVVLIDDAFPTDSEAAHELIAGIPFIELKLALPEDFAWFVERVFVTDRKAVNKGMIEAPL